MRKQKSDSYRDDPAFQKYIDQSIWLKFLNSDLGRWFKSFIRGNYIIENSGIDVRKDKFLNDNSDNKD